MTKEPAVVLFDGVCNLCNGAVQFVIRRDPRERFRFAALQSEAASALLSQAGSGPLPDSLVLVPRPLRDWAYARIARNRYRWFGRRDSCMVPIPELQQRFL